jgi:hypothetical protein
LPSILDLLLLLDLRLLMQQMERIGILSVGTPLRLLLENVRSHLAHSEDFVAVFEVIKLGDVML